MAALTMPEPTFSRTLKVGSWREQRGNSWATMRLELEVTLRPSKTGEGPELSICGSLYDSTYRRDGGLVSCGQNRDGLKRLLLAESVSWGLPIQHQPRKIAARLLSIWDRWHLNGMRAGCEHQRALGWTYEAHRDPKTFTGEACPTCGYSIGSRWLHEPLPADVLAFIQSLPEA